MSTLFKDAIAEAKQLKEMAEQNAKNKIIEAMTPKIRRLIEQELVGDFEEEDDEVPAEEFSIADVLAAAPEEEMAVLDLEDLDEPAPPVTVNVDGHANIAFSTSPIEMEEEEEEDDLLLNLNQESARALAKIIRNPNSLGTHEKDILESIKLLEEKIKGFNSLLSYVKINRRKSTLRESARTYYTRLLKEMISLRGDVILTEGTENKNGVRFKYNRVVKEMRNMSRRHAETLFDRLFEKKMKEGKKSELDELDLVFADEDLEALGVEEPGDIDVADLTVDVISDEGGEEEAAGEEVEVEDEELDLGELDVVLGAEDLDVLGVEDTEDVDVTGLSVDVEYAGEEAAAEEEEEEVIDIDEGMLRRELRRMRRLREQDGADNGDPYVDHGGEVVGDVVVDVDEEDLVNALADELGDPDVPAPTVEARIRRRLQRRRRVSETRRRPSRRRPVKVNESRKNRALSTKLVEYKKAVHSLRHQLTEMNLFNAKLLYVNKLMQNRNLKPKQQRAIVEALDNAKTLREAKLLYKSLTASLNRRFSKSLTEGRNARTLGSSSRSTRSATPAKSGVETDRWALLAGINNKES